MADILMTAGDDFEHPMDLKDDGVSIVIPSAFTLNAALLDRDDGTLIASTAVVEGTAGSDWANGKIVVVFTNSQTASIPAPVLGRLEVQLTTGAGKKTTYFSKWFIIGFGSI